MHQPDRNAPLSNWATSPGLRFIRVLISSGGSMASFTFLDFQRYHERNAVLMSKDPISHLLLDAVWSSNIRDSLDNVGLSRGISSNNGSSKPRATKRAFGFCDSPLGLSLGSTSFHVNIHRHLMMFSIGIWWRRNSGHCSWWSASCRFPGALLPEIVAAVLQSGWKFWLLIVDASHTKQWDTSQLVSGSCFHWSISLLAYLYFVFPYLIMVEVEAWTLQWQKCSHKPGDSSSSDGGMGTLAASTPSGLGINWGVPGSTGVLPVLGSWSGCSVCSPLAVKSMTTGFGTSVVSFPGVPTGGFLWYLLDLWWPVNLMEWSGQQIGFHHDWEWSMYFAQAVHWVY